VTADKGAAGATLHRAPRSRDLGPTSSFIAGDTESRDDRASNSVLAKPFEIGDFARVI